MKICYNCFNEIPDSAGTCPHCGTSADLRNADKYPHALPCGSVLNGKYIVGRVLGQGGFGITYVGQEFSSKMLVAIKEYFPDTMAVRDMSRASYTVVPFNTDRNESFEYGKKQFLDEARTLAAFIGSPNIVRVYSYFEENGTAYFVMEYVQGQSLKKYIESRGGRISWEEAWKLLMPVLDALSEVHSKKIVHRDIKPDNIIMTQDGNVKLIDFGAARYNYGEKSQSLTAVLTPGFAPLEQYFTRGKQGPWTDVYALAATLYFCITGAVPVDSVERSDEDTIKRPSELGASIPAYAEGVLMTALAVKAKDRFGTTYEFRNAVLAGMHREEDSSEQIKTEEEGSSEQIKTEEEGRGNSRAEKKLPVAALAALAALVLAIMIGRAVITFNRASEDTSVPKEKASEKAAQGKTPVAAGSIDVCLSSEPRSIDPALNNEEDGATMILHTFSGLAKWEKKEDGSLVIVPDCAEELVEGVENGDGTITYTYTLRQGLKWSDGQPVTAADFEFAWKRAADPATGADYGYLFEQIAGYDEMCEAADTNAGGAEHSMAGRDLLAVSALDNRTLEVKTKQRVPYWNELLAFPTYMPVREDIVSIENWAADPSTYIGNGPYVISEWKHNSVITMVRNPNYHDADKITMPALNFHMSDDAGETLTNFESGDWKMIDDVPANEIAALKEQYPDQFVATGLMGTYYVCWNVNEDILPKDSGLEGAEAEAARAEIRNAISLLLDRDYIVEVITQGSQTPASSFVASGLTDADGRTEFYTKAGHNDGFAGYYDVSSDALDSNYAAAIEILKKYYKFDEAAQTVQNFPTLTYIYGTGEGNKAIAEYLQNVLEAVGITIKPESQEWSAFLSARNSGDFSVARNGWLCDYNDPISMLDLWTANSGNNDCQLGKGAHKDVKAYSLDLTDLGYDIRVENGTWAQTYDVLIAQIKACTDTDIRYQLMHRAEDLLMSTGVICPLYYFTDNYMLDDSVKGFFSTPLGIRYFMYCTIE